MCTFFQGLSLFQQVFVLFVKLLIGVVIDVHLGIPLQLVHLPLDYLVFVLGRLIVEPRVYLVCLLCIQPGVFLQKAMDEPFELGDFLLRVL
jgi:hypothetical protein